MKKKIINDLENLLKSFKIKLGDNIIIHSNSAGLFQYSLNMNKNIIDVYLKTILKKIGKNGTLLIPTYNYSSTKKKTYSINNKSEVGIISNFLLTKNIKNRTKEPIFSHLVFGNLKKIFMEADINECFGENSSFDLMIQNKFKIICFCCSPNNMTFLHYIEKKCLVNYRYEKIFFFKSIINNKKKIMSLKYFVGKKSLDYAIKNKNLLKLVNQGFIQEKKFKNFNCYLSDTITLFQLIKK